MNVESIKSRLAEVTNRRERAGTNFFIDAGATAFGLYFGTLLLRIGITQPEANPVAVVVGGVSVVAAGAALYRLRQALVSTRERDYLWKKQDQMRTNRPSSLSANPC